MHTQAKAGSHAGEKRFDEAESLLRYGRREMRRGFRAIMFHGVRGKIESFWPGKMNESFNNYLSRLPPLPAEAKDSTFVYHDGFVDQGFSIKVIANKLGIDCRNFLKNEPIDFFDGGTRPERYWMHCRQERSGIQPKELLRTLPPGIVPLTALEGMYFFAQFGKSAAFLRRRHEGRSRRWFLDLPGTVCVTEKGLVKTACLGYWRNGLRLGWVLWHQKSSFCTPLTRVVLPGEVKVVSREAERLLPLLHMEG